MLAESAPDDCVESQYAWDYRSFDVDNFYSENVSQSYWDRDYTTWFDGVACESIEVFHRRSQKFFLKTYPVEGFFIKNFDNDSIIYQDHVDVLIPDKGRDQRRIAVWEHYA